MSLRWHLILIVLLPILIVGGILAAGMRVPVPEIGRGYVLRLPLPGAGQPIGLPTVYGPDDPAAPLVVIDAGHGGKDPGAVGSGVREKDITLSLAKALKDQLIEEGGIRVAMTREDDRLLALSERPEIARRLEADLFLSIHADSAGDTQDVSGASVYTLSNAASSQAAALFARRENDADRVNGLALDNQSEEVSAILVELSQRRAQQDSGDFAGLVLRAGEGLIDFHPQPKRSASLAVLRAPDVPSALFESGFVTNPDEAERLTSDEGRAQFARAMASAIRLYFIRRGEI
jgi:N-acetylmuramoyl-L-alanine amidase